MNVKKMFASLAGVLMLAQAAAPMITGAATYSDELQGAYDYAYSVGITTMNSIDNANMYGDLTRGQLSKMISQWAEKEMGVKADTTAVCSFTDTDTAEGDLATYVVKSCQMGLMGQGIEKFRPGDKVTRGEFGTVLSRAIWGDKYDGENPYYAKHLQALKDAGIMTNISDPNATEMRGWVMLMLERAAETVNPSECNDPAVLLACSLGSDSCPAACRDNGDETEVDDKGNVVVKSGDLSITATAATDRKAVNNGVSDLDTITLRTSEDLTVNSITLERYGYSSADNVSVWLEDAYGNKIADSKDVSTSKDTVTLKIKKDYREMAAGNNDITTVVELSGAAAGGTIGFKVTAVESSAKNVDLSDYTAYTYDIVAYSGARATVNVKGNSKEYNYEAGNLYEVSRLKVKAGASAISVNGLTLTNQSTGGINVFDVDEFVSKVEVTADGKAVNGLKYNLTKDNELVMSFDNIDIDINKDVQFVVSIAMDNFDDFGDYARLVLADNGDLKATEKKTGARLTIVAPAADAYKTYQFNGSKIKLSNTKLASTIDAAQGSQDVVIAKGTITVGEEIKVSSYSFDAGVTWVIEEMRLIVAGEEFDAKATNNNRTFTFTNVNIEKWGDIELVVDIFDEDRASNKSVTIKSVNTNSTSIGKDFFSGARYVDAKKTVQAADIAGSISISNVKVQESKGSLKNNLSKTIEFTKGETSERVTVFNGTYTAKKADVTLKEFAIAGNSGELKKADTAEFYLYINGEEVGMIDADDIVTKDAAKLTTFDSYESMTEDVYVEAGKSVNVEVKAVMQPNSTNSSSNIDLDLYLRGEDKNWTPAGKNNAALTTFKFVVNGSLTISDSATLAKNTVALQANEVTVAKFTLKPSKADSVKLDNLVFDLHDLTGVATNADLTWINNHVTVEVDGTEIDAIKATTGWTDLWEEDTATNNNVKFDGSDVADIDEEVEVIVKVTWLDPHYTNPYEVKLVSVNGVLKNSTYTRLILPAIVSFDSMSSDGAVTKFKVSVEDYDGQQIKNLKFHTKTLSGTKAEWEDGTVTNGMTIEVSNQATAEVVTKVTFTIVDNGVDNAVELTNTAYPDFFKTKDGKTLRVSKVD